VKTSKHLSKITTATSQLATWIMRTFKTRDADVMLALWKSLVIPCFGYCSQLYNPSNVSQRYNN